ncbi:MAG: RidA family protein, partial [Flavobacteriaceae bacterium]|nr:RidA family protein [Flavobacteriaceae bacterium]
MKYLLVIGFFLSSFFNVINSQTNDLYDYDVEKRIEELNITLQKSGKPIANYLNAVQTGNLIFLSGKGPRDKDGNLITGKLGKDLTVEQGYDAARLVAITQLSVLK